MLYDSRRGDFTDYAYSLNSKIRPFYRSNINLHQHNVLGDEAFHINVDIISHTPKATSFQHPADPHT